MITVKRSKPKVYLVNILLVCLVGGDGLIARAQDTGNMAVVNIRGLKQTSSGFAEAS